MRAGTKTLWKLTRGQRLRYGAAMAALVLSSCVMYLVPLIPQVVLDGVLAQEQEGVGALTHRLVELLGGRELLRRHLWAAALLVVTLTALAGVLTWLRGRWAADATENIVRRVRDRLFDHIQHAPCRWLDAQETGDLVQRCTSDVETLRQFLVTQLVEVGRAGMMLLAPLPLMLAMDVRMTLVSVAVVPPLVVFSYVVFRRIQARFLLVEEAEARMTSRLQENLTGIRVVRAFGRGPHEIEVFDRRNAEHRRREYDLFRLLAAFWSVSDLMCMTQMGLVVGLGGWWLAEGRLPVGTFYFFLAAVHLFLWPIRMMGRILAELGKATVALGRIQEILQTAREDDEPIREGSAGPFRGEVVFEGVRFSHAAGTPVLDGIDLRLESGETVALLGPSGSGKTTLANLLTRLYEPDEGRILLDGRELCALPRAAVRRQVAAVLQDPFLYTRTVGDNIRIGRMHAGEDDMIAAARDACIHASIERFPSGYETLVGERGVTLSGGQRQRVAMARALLEEPAVLILDDALSAVDSVTEQKILDVLARRRGRHTTLLITQRLTSLHLADRIVVLESGRISQQGTHEELSGTPGLYRTLWEIHEGGPGAADGGSGLGKEGRAP